MCERTRHLLVGLVQVWHISGTRAIGLRNIPRFACIVLGEVDLVRVGISHPTLEPTGWGYGVEDEAHWEGVVDRPSLLEGSMN